MKITWFLCSLITLTLSLGASDNTFANDYFVVVNDANSFTAADSNMKREVRLLFLKEKKSWPDGAKAKPLGPDAGSAAHSAFISQVLNMSTADLAQHWMRVKQMSGNTPPREYKSSRILMKLVAKDAGAFTVISSEDKVSLPEGVKVLFGF